MRNWLIAIVIAAVVLCIFCYVNFWKYKQDPAMPPGYVLRSDGTNWSYSTDRLYATFREFTNCEEAIKNAHEYYEYDKKFSVADLEKIREDMDRHSHWPQAFCK